MAQWLFKTEPGDYSWDDFIKDGRTDWDGVKNHQAAANMRAMKIGEKAYFYRSLKDPAVLGVMEIVKEAYPDPDDEKGKFVRVDVQPAGLLPAPVPLSAIKARSEERRVGKECC